MKTTSARQEQLAELTAPQPQQFSALLDELEEAIGRSSYIRDLQNNWDEDGSVAILPSTWERAVAFLRKSSDVLVKEGSHIGIPQITPGPSGSVDIHWQTDRFFMLLNVRPSGPSDFYGETRDGLSLRGTFVPELHHQGILSWLKERGR